MITAETDAVADHLRDDLQRIARNANDELKILRRKEMSDPLRQAEATRVIEQARARAVRRVESTLRHLQTAMMPAQTGPDRCAGSRCDRHGKHAGHPRRRRRATGWSSATKPGLSTTPME